jgi:putative copper export protein
VSVPHGVLHAGVRWLDFIGLTTLIGALAFRWLIVRPPLLSRQEFDDFDRSCWSVVAGSILLVALTSVGDLVLRTMMMSGKALGDVGPALPVVLRQTHYGAVWTARVSLIGLLLTMAWLLKTRGARGRSWSLAASFVAASLIALTTSLSGHAADWGDVTLPVLIDWLHLLAVSTWIGGLFTLGFVLHHSFSPSGEETQVPGVVAIVARFSRMAACCVAVFLPAGLYNAWLQVTSLSPLVSTAYGWTLLAKALARGLVLDDGGANPILLRAAPGVPHRHAQPADLQDDRSVRGWSAGGDEAKRRPENPPSVLSVRPAGVDHQVAALACTALLTQPSRPSHPSPRAPGATRRPSARLECSH